MGSSDESDDPEGEYKVEAILGSRQIKGRTQYLIKWDGYSSSENTWEPVEHLSGAKQLLARFKGEQRRKISQKRHRPDTAAAEAPASHKPKKRKLAAAAAHTSSDPPDESAAARPRKPAAPSAGGKAAAPCGGVALPPRWRCRPSRDGASRWTWTDPKGHVYRTAEAARIAVARWEKRLGAADDSKRGRPAKAGKPAPPEARALSAGGGGGSSGGGEGSEVRCCCCGQISLGGALTVTVAGGEPVCRRCSTLLLDGVGMAATGPQLDATMTRLGLAPASMGAAGSHRANDAGGAGTSSGAPPAAKAKHSILGVRWERCEQKTEREVREVVSSMLASLEKAHGPKKTRKPASKVSKVEVVLPMDAQPGQKLLLSLRGQQLVFEVPANAHGGLRLSVSLPESFSVSEPIRARSQPIAAPRHMPVTASPSKQSREQEHSRECSKVLQRVLKQVEREHLMEKRTEQEVKAVMDRMVTQLEKTQQRMLEKQRKQRARDLEKAAKQRAKEQAREQAREEAKRKWAEVQQTQLLQEREQRIKRDVCSVLNAIICHLERNEKAKAHAAERERLNELHRPPQQRKKAAKQLHPPPQLPQQPPQLPQRTPQLPQQPPQLPQRTPQLPQHAPNFSQQPPHLGQNPLQQQRQQSPQQRHKAPQQAQQVRRQQQQQPFESRSEEQLLLEQRLQHLQHLQRREDELRQQRALLEPHLKDLPRQQEQLHQLHLQRDEQALLEQLRQLQSAAATLPLAPLEPLEPSQLQLVRQQLLQLQAAAVHTPQQAAQLQLLHTQMLQLVQSHHDEAARRGEAPRPSYPAATLTPRKRKDRAHGRVQPIDRSAEESGSSANAAHLMSAGSHPAKKRKERKHHKSPKELGSVRSDDKRPVQYPRVVFKLAQPSEHHEEESAEEDVKCFQLHEEQGGRLGCLLPAHHEGEHMRLGKRRIVKPTILADE